MEEAVTRQHAHPNTLAHIYHKTVKTSGNWIPVYERTGTYQRVDTGATRKFTATHRKWLCDFYAEHPLAYLDEARDAFVRAYQVSILVSTVWQIIHDGGLTRTVLERRAMHIKEQDVFRFVEELSHINWFHSNIIFLDKVSFDNRGMIRKRGYSLRGQKIAIRRDFQRKRRVSVLACLSVTGIIDYYNTEGTFDSVQFFQCCRDFAYSARGKVRQYPGSISVWIICSSGVIASSNDLLPFVVETCEHPVGFDMSKMFQHCGWKSRCYFDPSEPLSRETQQSPRTANSETQQNGETDSLGFTTREVEDFEGA
ncbi:hypothetical protein PHMEG_00027489 [Phytophthora megakarya]|uniref:Uncharacterized protein n=1 Tax=Phytophthora megakarya TaxID=4795 RepID=A0A225V6T3_9STRA|nr:hypothetical protein PHMEG_00027489 [Phytophthora megakarya]